MIILNDSSTQRVETLAERMAKVSKANNDLKASSLIRKIELQIGRESEHGSNTMVYVIHDKEDGYITDGVLKNIFQHFLDNGFDIAYNYVSESVEETLINFHKFNIGW